MFAVNYIQNRYISAEFCAEIAKLFEVLNVKTMVEFHKAIESLQNEPHTGNNFMLSTAILLDDNTVPYRCRVAYVISVAVVLITLIPSLAQPHNREVVPS